MVFQKNQTNIIAKASLWYTVCSIVQKGITMLLVPLYVRMMTTEEYGIYTLEQSWESIVLVFTTLGLCNSVFYNCLIQYKQMKEQVTSSFLGLIISLTIIWCLIFMFFNDFWMNFLGFSNKFIISMLFNSMFTVTIQLWYAKKRFDYEYKSVAIITIVTSILILGGGLLFTSNMEEKAFAAVLAITFAQGIVSIILSTNIFLKGRRFFCKEIWKYALCFNIPLIPHFLSTSILQQADRVMIEKLCGTSEAGIYGFSYKISSVILIFNNALLASINPWIYRKLNEKKISDIHNRIFGTFILIGGIDLVFILFAPEIVNLLGTTQYKEALYIVPPVSLSCFMIYLFNVFANVTYFYGKNKLITLASMLAALFNIILNAYFIPKKGYIAAGYTTLISYIFLALMHYMAQGYALHKAGIKEKVYNVSQILFFSIILVAVGMGIMFFYEEWAMRFLFILLIILLIIVKRKKIVAVVEKK